MRKFLIVLFVSLCVAGVSSSPGWAAEKYKASPRIELMSKDKAEKLASGSDMPKENLILTSLVGEWNYNLKFWPKNGVKPELSTGNAVNKMIFDKLFLSSEMNSVLNIGGYNIPYNSLAYIGYDTAKKAFTSVLLDSMHTGVTVGIGQYNKKTNAIEEKGRFTFPLLEKQREYRSEIEFSDSSTYKVSIYFADGSGTEYKAIEVEYHRK